MTEASKERGKSGGKKNPLSNATMFALAEAVRQVFPSACIRAPINWSSLTKGKYSLWLPKTETIEKKEGKDQQLQSRANGVVESKQVVTITQGSFPENVWDPAGTDQDVSKVIAVNVLSLAKRFLRPGQGEADPLLQEWEGELQIGQAAKEAIDRAEIAKVATLTVEGSSGQVKDFCSEMECAGAASKKCDECKSSICGRCTHKCKKGDGRSLNIKPGARSRVGIMADEIISLFDEKRSPADLREELEYRLNMFHNLSHTEGFVIASNQQLSPYLLDLQNRL